MTYDNFANARRLRFEQLERRRMLATFTVTNVLDGPVAAPEDLPGSLRQAVYDANNNPGGDEIIFDSVVGTITLSAGTLRVTDTLDLLGPGAKQLAISGGHQFPVIESVIAQPSDNTPVLIRGLTVREGFGGYAGGIFSNAPLTISDVKLTGNSSYGVGGLRGTSLVMLDSSIEENIGHSVGGISANSVSIDRSLILNNEAIDPSMGVGGIDVGGGAFGMKDGDATISHSTIQGNSGVMGGVSGATLTFASSSILDNVGTHGGGVNTFAHIDIANSLVSGNTAGIDGGGLHILRGQGVVTNTTISGNVSNMYGGGISQIGGNVLIANSTITANLALDGEGVGIRLTPASRVAIYASIVSGNFGTDITAPSRSLLDSQGFNLIGVHNSYANFLDSDLVGVTDPGLGPLTDNGGTTATHALLLGSPAFDVVAPDHRPGSVLSITTPGIDDYEIPYTDGRGSPYPRMFGDRSDIGAFEWNSGLSNIDQDNDGDVDCSDIDEFMSVIASGSNDPSNDLNGDNLVNLVDRDLWLTFAADVNGLPGPYLLGDANLDGTVDALDFIIWNDSKFTSSAAWCSGEFTGDGIVDGLDYIEWNVNKFTSSGGFLAPINHTLNRNNLMVDARVGTDWVRETHSDANAELASAAAAAQTPSQQLAIRIDIFKSKNRAIRGETRTWDQPQPFAMTFDRLSRATALP